MSFDNWVVTIAVERRVNQASEPWWMKRGCAQAKSDRRLRSRLPSPPQPETTILMRMR